jgi:CRISPR/Cas system CSM-associated protein Csm3 (group 7 of RAMP superfamily)
MARQVTGRLRIAGKLVARTPLHVGGHGDDVDTDLPLARDGRGRYYVPGTSLAGGLREWCGDMCDPALVRTTWGYQEGDQGRASAVVVEDAVIPSGAAVEVRDGVGIDRVWGCAAEHIKYDRAILPRGTAIPLAILVELAEPADEVRRMFADLLAALRGEEVRFGAARTRGLGRLQLAEGFRVIEETLNTRDGLIAALAGAAPTVTLPATGRKRPRLEIAIDWQPVGPLMVKSGIDGIGVDMFPLLSGCDGALALVLPGSSVKGALRGHAERIVRTLLGTIPDRTSKPKKRFLAHLRLPLIEDLFGSPGRSKSDTKANRAKSDTQSHREKLDLGLGLGALGVDDCYATHVRIRPECWEDVIRADSDVAPGERKSALRRKLESDDLGLPDWTASYHVAVDRWTGGAAEGFLYTVLEPHGVVWEPLHLRLDPGRLQRLESEREALALLLFVLRDLSDGRIPLGFATHRGMGAVAVTRIRFSAVNCQPPLSELDGVQLDGGDFAGLPAALVDGLSKRWQQWIHTEKERSR